MSLSCTRVPCCRVGVHVTLVSSRCLMEPKRSKDTRGIRRDFWSRWRIQSPVRQPMDPLGDRWTVLLPSHPQRAWVFPACPLPRQAEGPPVITHSGFWPEQTHQHPRSRHGLFTAGPRHWHQSWPPPLGGPQRRPWSRWSPPRSAPQKGGHSASVPRV